MGWVKYSTKGATWGTDITSQPSDANILNSGTFTGTVGASGTSAANMHTRISKITNAGAFSGSLAATQFPMAAMVTNADAATVKSTLALNNVANENRATILGGTLTGQINDGTTNFTAAELLKVRAGFDGLDGTAVLKEANANTALRNSGVTLAATGVLSGGGTSAQVKIGSIADSKFDGSGDITGDINLKSALTIPAVAGNKIICGNITIDGQYGRIVITD